MFLRQQKIVGRGSEADRYEDFISLDVIEMALNRYYSYIIEY